MDTISVFQKFKTEKQAVKHLEKIRWGKKSICPYCGVVGATKVKNTIKYHHCGACNKQFSVTVSTIFHDTKLPLQKWLVAIAIISNAKKGISSRELARQLKVNKDTAWRIQMQIREAMQDKEQKELFSGIIEVDECYIGGKKKKGDKKKDDDDNFTNKRGRGTDKQGVIGAIDRESKKVIAQKQDKFTFAELKAFLIQNADFEKITLYTDDFTGYKPFKKIVSHAVINHSKREYSKNGIHTNTIEGFWGIFKRAIVGSYHKLSTKHLDAYIQECCFKYNNRNNANTFDLLLSNCVR
jgi:transposase-like protein